MNKYEWQPEGPKQGELGKVCEHGSLARQCLVCELQAENARLRAEALLDMKEIQGVIDERDRLREALKKMCVSHENMYHIAFPATTLTGEYLCSPMDDCIRREAEAALDKSDGGKA